MHLKQPGFSYSACREFTKTKKKMKKNYADSKYRLCLQE